VNHIKTHLHSTLGLGFVGDLATSPQSFRASSCTMDLACGGAENSLSNVDGEDEADTRRLIRFRVIHDRWRRIDGCRVVVVARWRLVTPAVLVPPASLIPFVPMVIFTERRRNRYATDHRGEDERHHDLPYCRTKLPGSRVRCSHSNLPSLSQNRVCCPDVVLVAIIFICVLPLISCGLDGGITYQHPSSERPTCWHRVARRSG
jgi:hypothetical protein